MSLPIPIIAGNFEKFHKTMAKKNKLLKRREAVALAREKEEKVSVTVFLFISSKITQIVRTCKAVVVFTMMKCYPGKSFLATLATQKLQTFYQPN